MTDKAKDQSSWRVRMSGWGDRLRLRSRSALPTTSTSPSLRSVDSRPPRVSVTNLATPLFAPSASNSSPLTHSIATSASPAPSASNYSPVSLTPAILVAPDSYFSPVTHRTASPLPSTPNIISAISTPAICLTPASNFSPVTHATASPASSTSNISSAASIPGVTHSAPVPDPTGDPASTHESNTADTQTLWQKALECIPSEDKEGVDLQGHGLLHHLIETTKAKKQQIEDKKWVYRNKRGEKVSYADRFLTLINKYSVIVDISIQHDPHVVALVWAGFRFLLQVV